MDSPTPRSNPIVRVCSRRTASRSFTIAASNPNLSVIRGLVCKLVYICHTIDVDVMSNDVKNVRGFTMNELLQKFKDNVTRLALELEDRGFFKNVKSWARTLKSALPKF